MTDFNVDEADARTHAMKMMLAACRYGLLAVVTIMISLTYSCATCDSCDEAEGNAKYWKGVHDGATE